MSEPRSKDIDFLNQHGATLDLIRSIEWSDTSIGAPDGWPQSLRSALSICINSNFPIAIYWGPDLILLYNEAWSPIPGNKHPWAFGRPAIAVWPEIWSAIEPQFKKALSGTPGGSKDALLPMQRHGYTEECYFDFTFTPIYGESGNVEGIFNAVIETTYRVINERRAGILQRLGEAISGALTPMDVLSHASAVLRDAKADIPFFYIYEIVGGLPVVVSSQPDSLPPVVKEWPLHEVVANGTARLVGVTAAYLPMTDEGHWPEAPTEAFIIPIKGNDGNVSALLAAGVSSRRRFDKDYRAFFESVANIVSAEINTLQSLARERERAESLAAINKAKTAFFSNISHEFRTPLTLMLSPLEDVLSDGANLSASQKENLETSLRNLLRLQKLVNTLLDFSRIEAGKIDARFEEVEISRHTRDLASSFRSAIEASGITYEVSVDDVRHPVVVDVDMWDKIVLNLISNAFKYTEKGRIKVVLYEHDEWLYFKVTDSGIGISADHINRIFERFYRVANPGGRSQEGTGIGLALVKELVQLHHGEIFAESRLGEGSTFTVRLPMAEMRSQMKLGANGHNTDNKTRRAFVEEASKWNIQSYNNLRTAKPSEETSNKPRVLIADDNSDMRDYIIRLLSDDFQVHAASNGEDAYIMAQQIRPDLVLSDVMMPKMDGFGLLTKLRSNLNTRHIPVVFLSARAGDEAKLEGIQVGADDYLVKPFSAKELVARVTNQVAIAKTRRETEKDFFNLFIQSPAHIHVFKGPDHIVEFFHPLGKKIIGRDITGQKIREALPEVAGQGYFEMLDAVFHNGTTISLPQSKVLLRDEDGSVLERYFHITYLPWRGVDGKIQGVLQFSLDVTEQAQTILKTKESEERFRLLANSIPQFVWIADGNGKVEYMSDQWEHYTGTSPSEGIKAFSSFIHPDDVEEVRAKWRMSMATKQPWTSEFRLKNVKTGEYRWFSGHTVPLLDAHQNVSKWIGSSSDIQAQKTITFELESVVAERTSELIKLNQILKVRNDELSAAQSFLQTVLDTSVELVTAFDRDLNFTFVNKRLNTVSDKSPEELIGRNLLELHPGFEKTDGYGHLMRALAGETIHIEARRPHSDNSLVFETFIIPLRQNGEINGVVTMQRDITSIVKLTQELQESNEQLRRSNEDLQQFAHVTSHDLKEPVRKIKMYGNILNTEFSEYLPETGKDYLTRIQKAAGRISAMIDGVLQYATIDAADQFLQDIDLNNVVRNIMEDLEIPIKERHATVAHSALPRIKGYPTLIYQLFYNLINNSLKFGKRDVTPEIHIEQAALSESEFREPGGEFLKIIIRDNGVGFDPAYSEKIFESFTRLHPKDRFEGTGLGLALCRKIVLRHHGFIKASGELNKGATFSVYLPKAILI